MDSSLTFFDRLRATYRHRQHIIWEAAGWMAVWLVASPTLIECIKHLTSTKSLSFPFPWLLVGFSNAGVWALCTLFQLMPGVAQDSTVEVPWKTALPMGLMQGFEIGIGVEVIHQISITLRTEILMLCPALMFVGSYLGGLEKLEARIVLSVSVVTLGGILAVYGSMTTTGLELVPLALFGSCISTVRWVFTQKWLSSSGANGRAKPSPITLVQRMAPMTSLVGFSVAVFREPGCYQSLPMLPYPFMVASLMFTISFVVCICIFAEMRVVQLTSAMLLAFMCPVHNISVILMGASLKGTKILPINWIGIVLCAVASGFYASERLQDKDGPALDQLPLQAKEVTGEVKRAKQAAPYHSTEARARGTETTEAKQPELTSTSSEA